MSDTLPPWSLLVAFLAASVVLAVTPGQGVLYIVTRSLAQGRCAGLASVAGVAVGNLGNAVGAAVGLGALLSVSSTAFLMVKYAGALYLLWLGVRVLRTQDREVVANESVPTRCRLIFRDGFIVALLNPKTAVFFATFLPQFMGATAQPILQSVMLGVLFVAIAVVTDTAYAMAAGAVAPVLSSARSAQTLGRYFTGGTFIGLSVFTALSGSRSGK